MEEDKAAEYFDDLTRRGEGAARFKQGLGYSSASSSSTSFSRPLAHSSLGNFVAASKTQTEADIEKECRIERIHNKLRRKDSVSEDSPGSVQDRRRYGEDRSFERDIRKRRRSRSRSCSSEEENRHRRSGHRNRSDSRAYRDDRLEREPRSEGSRRERRSDCSTEGDHSMQRSDIGRDDHRRRNGGSSDTYYSNRSRSIYKDGRQRSRNSSPTLKKPQRGAVGGKGDVDFSRLIHGYDKMTPAERVKAKMKFQLSQTASKDSKECGKNNWERFDFNKNAPLDDEYLDAPAEDDSKLLKDIGRDFRFSAVEATREAEIQSAHDDAIFGVPLPSPAFTEEGKDHCNISLEEDTDANASKTDENKTNLTSIVNEKVLTMQRGSWRDRARKPQSG